MKFNAFARVISVLFLINLALFSFCILIVKSDPRVIIVPTDYATIQEAVNASSPGDTIIVLEGTYDEGEIYIDKMGLSLLANGTVVVDGLREGGVFVVRTNNVTISGFTVTNSSREHNLANAGIFLDDGSNCNISNNLLTNNYFGIVGYSNSSYNNIIDNNVTNNLVYGIFLKIGGDTQKPCGNILVRNKVWNNSEGGILLEYS